MSAQSALQPFWQSSSTLSSIRLLSIRCRSDEWQGADYATAFHFLLHGNGSAIQGRQQLVLDLFSIPARIEQTKNATREKP